MVEYLHFDEHVFGMSRETRNCEVESINTFVTKNSAKMGSNVYRKITKSTIDILMIGLQSQILKTFMWMILMVSMIIDITVNMEFTKESKVCNTFLLFSEIKLEYFIESGRIHCFGVFATKPRREIVYVLTWFWP